MAALLRFGDRQSRADPLSRQWRTRRAFSRLHTDLLLLPTQLIPNSKPSATRTQRAQLCCTLVKRTSAQSLPSQAFELALHDV
jgi:hypothetical protein